jgi:energy-coupling factor transport system permease protein
LRNFASYHPVVLISYFATVIALSMFAGHPVILLLALSGGIVVRLALEGADGSWRSLAFYGLFFLLIAGTNPLFSHQGVTVLFFLNANPVTLESFLYGMGIGAMIVGVMVWFGNYSTVVTTDKFLFLFGRFLPRLTLIFSMVLRFIPLFRLQIRKVANARKALGGFPEENLASRIRSGIAVFSIMVTWSLEMAIETAASMKARGYGVQRRSSFSVFRFTTRDLVMLIVIAALSIPVLVGSALGVLAFSYYPYVASLRTDFGAMAVYLAFAVLAFLPAIIDWKENLQWNYSISRI